jgi:type IV pilus assembly protein PilV
VHLTRRRPAAGARARGFTLIELLVTLAVVAFGLMGLAKLQAAATAETQVSRIRSVMTFQAESLAAALRANRAYWANADATTQPTVAVAAGTGTFTNTDTTAGPGAWKDCVAQSCTAAQMAVYDLQAWATAFNGQFPAASAQVACATSSGPVSCDITLQWPERYVAINRSTAPVAGDTNPTGTLVVHVQP